MVMVLPYNLTACHELLSRLLRPGDLALDATAGNGRDTEFLARAVLPAGRVFAFDIQTSALDRTRQRLHHAGLGHGCELFLASHADLDAFLPASARGQLRAAVFNLGYLPGGDAAVITRPHSTVAALQALESWMAPGGLTTIMCYLGHPGGAEEGAAVEAYCRGLDWKRARVLRQGFLNEPRNSTVLYCVSYR